MSSRKFSTFFLSLVALIVGGAGSTAAQEFTILPPDGINKMSVGKQTPIEITSETDLGKVSWSGQVEFFTTIENTSIDGNKKKATISLTAKKPGTGTLVFSVLGFAIPKSLKFTISPTLKFSDLLFESATPGNALKDLSPTNKGSSTPILQDETYLIRVTKADNSEIPRNLLKATAEPADAAEAEFKDGELKITGKNPKKGVIVRLESEGQVSTNTFTFDIAEAVGNIDVGGNGQINLKQGDTAKPLSDFVQIKGKAGTKLSPPDAKATCSIQDTTVATVTPNCETITAKNKADRTVMTITSGGRPFPITVVVAQAPARIVISSPNGKLEVSYPNRPLNVKATVTDADEKPMLDQNQPLDWTVPVVADRAFVRLNPNPINNSAEIIANDAVTENRRVIIRACLASVPAAAAAAVLPPAGCGDRELSVRKPFDLKNFRPLKIRLDMMDSRTAKDLFGSRAADEYFIAKVRLFNVIGKGDEDFGNSILVYSESLEVKVAVEWRQKGGNVMTPVWERNELGELKKDADEKYIQKKRENGQLVYTDSTTWQTLDEPTAAAWFNLPITKPFKDTKLKRCVVIEQDDMFVPYRPLTYEMVANTQERRDSRSLRSRLLLTMNGVASLTSFVTSIAVPGAGSDLPLGLDKFRNLLIPSFEKLFPSHNEVQRQNITSMVMRPLEEIPFGSDITRIIFFPRKSISGVLLNQPNARNTELRISAISISDACAEAGVIKKATEEDN